ncbi:MAG: hypothetical protein JRI54_07460 [Deltaproteobacteria bacterium]|nr:hypothetical protein [Deltaproteobacteria bacterium]
MEQQKKRHKNRGLAGLALMVAFLIIASCGYVAWAESTNDQSAWGKGQLVAQRGRGFGFGRGQNWNQKHRLGRNSATRLYDPATVETVKGRVERVDIENSDGKGHSEAHLILRTNQETISVSLGPAWYYERQALKIEAGDQVEIKGSRLTRNEKRAIIAAEVRKDEEILVLRDSTGRPGWAGWRAGNKPNATAPRDNSGNWKHMDNLPEL